MNHSSLITKWQHVLDRVDIPTWTETLTLCFLAELASKSDSIIECGTYLGATAKVMLLANPKLQLFCIDTFECRGEPMMMEYLRQVGHVAFRIPAEKLSTFEICLEYSLELEVRTNRCFLIKGDSEAGAKKLKDSISPIVNYVDAVWVDDGHAEEDVLRDISCLMPFIKPGGVMVGHDFDVPYNDVARGVIRSGITYDVPIPRMWRHVKPGHNVILANTGHPM